LSEPRRQQLSTSEEQTCPKAVPIFPLLGLRAWGWFKPDTTGDYDFFIRSDDASLNSYLNSVNAGSGTNTIPDVQVDSPIAEEYNCCNPFQEPPAQTATASPIHLGSWQVLWHGRAVEEGGGGDYVQVAWRLTGNTNAASTLSPINAVNTYTLATPAGQRATITTQPTPKTVIQGRPDYINVVVDTTACARNLLAPMV